MTKQINLPYAKTYYADFNATQGCSHSLQSPVLSDSSKHVFITVI